MSVPEDREGLRFPCECVSGRRGGYSDPWTGITKNNLLPNGTKEEILNLEADCKMLSEEIRAYEGVADQLRAKLAAKERT